MEVSPMMKKKLWLYLSVLFCISIFVVGCLAPDQSTQRGLVPDQIVQIQDDQTQPKATASRDFATCAQQDFTICDGLSEGDEIPSCDCNKCDCYQDIDGRLLPQCTEINCGPGINAQG